MEAAHEEAHDSCWFEAKDWLRHFGYKEFAFLDLGVLNAEESSGKSDTQETRPARQPLGS